MEYVIQMLKKEYDNNGMKINFWQNTMWRKGCLRGRKWKDGRVCEFGWENIDWEFYGAKN